MSTNAIKPEDVLADQENFADFEGITVRKGSVAAFLKNIDMLDEERNSAEQRAAALEQIQQLAPAMVVLGLYKHAVFKNKQVQEILEKAQP